MTPREAIIEGIAQYLQQKHALKVDDAYASASRIVRDFFDPSIEYGNLEMD